MALDLNYFFKIFVAYPGLVQPIVILPCLFMVFYSIFMVFCGLDVLSYMVKY